MPELKAGLTQQRSCGEQARGGRPGVVEPSFPLTEIGLSGAEWHTPKMLRS